MKSRSLIIFWDFKFSKKRSRIFTEAINRWPNPYRRFFQWHLALRHSATNSPIITAVGIQGETPKHRVERKSWPAFRYTNVHVSAMCMFFPTHKLPIKSDISQPLAVSWLHITKLSEVSHLSKFHLKNWIMCRWAAKFANGVYHVNSETNETHRNTIV